MKDEKFLCDFDLQDSQDESDKWLCWDKIDKILAEKYGQENLRYTLKNSGLIDDQNNPITQNAQFNYFRLLDVGFKDPQDNWHTLKVHYFITWRGFTKIADLMKKSKPICF